jgi:hypothetical protein
VSRTYYKKRAQIARPTQTSAVPEVYGIPAAEIAALCGVDIATARRWKSGQSRVPMAARKLLAGDLSAFGHAWKGWKIVGGKLVSPEGWDYTPGEVLAIPFLRSQIAHLDNLRKRHEQANVVPEVRNSVPRRARA